MMIFPGLAIFLVVTVFNMLGDSVRDILTREDVEKCWNWTMSAIAYGETQAVEDFSLHMEPGEIVSLVGESGSGKTSVIRGILGLLPGGGAVTQGNIVFDGKDLLDITRSSGAPSEGGRFP